VAVVRTLLPGFGPLLLVLVLVLVLVLLQVLAGTGHWLRPGMPVAAVAAAAAAAAACPPVETRSEILQTLLLQAEQVGRGRQEVQVMRSQADLVPRPGREPGLELEPALVLEQPLVSVQQQLLGLAFSSLF